MNVLVVISVVLGLSVGAYATRNPCPLHWAYYDGSCLYFSLHRPEQWAVARNICRENHNSHLVTIDNEAKSDYIGGILSVLSSQQGAQHVHWIGGTDSLIEGSWNWVETDMPIGPYTNWGSGYPQNATKYHDCLVTNLVNQTMIWRDRPCKTEYNYICEFRINDPSGIILGK